MNTGLAVWGCAEPTQAFPSEAWLRFWKLVDALGKWFDIHFVTINKGSWDDTKESPKITGSRVLELQSLSGRHS
jgi:hypothetical protein